MGSPAKSSPRHFRRFRETIPAARRMGWGRDNGRTQPPVTRHPTHEDADVSKKDKKPGFFAKLNDKIRRSRFGNRIVSVYEGLGTPGQSAAMRTSSPFAHPFKFRQEAKGKATVQNLGYNPTAEALRWRIVNGPELNILFLGIPFLLDFGITAAVDRANKPRRQRLKRQQAAAPNAERRKSVTLKIKRTPLAPSTDVTTAALDQAPFSGEALVVYTGLLDAGMSAEGAKMVAGGELHGLEATEHLCEGDCSALERYLLSDRVSHIESDESE